MPCVHTSYPVQVTIYVDMGPVLSTTMCGVLWVVHRHSLAMGCLPSVKTDDCYLISHIHVIFFCQMVKFHRGLFPWRRPLDNFVYNRIILMVQFVVILCCRYLPVKSYNVTTSDLLSNIHHVVNKYDCIILSICFYFSPTRPSLWARNI